MPTLRTTAARKKQENERGSERGKPRNEILRAVRPFGISYTYRNSPGRVRRWWSPSAGSIPGPAPGRGWGRRAGRGRGRGGAAGGGGRGGESASHAGASSASCGRERPELRSAF